MIPFAFCPLRTRASRLRRFSGPRLIVALTAAATAIVLPSLPFFVLAAHAQTVSGLTFSQLNYELDPSAPVLNSDVGHLDIDLSALPLSSGYLNVQTSQGWVIQNMPISPTYLSAGYSLIGIKFDLGTSNGSPLASLTATVALAIDPVTAFSDVALLPGALVQTGDYLIGHDLFENATGYGNAEGGGVVGVKPPVGAVTFAANGRNALTIQPGHPNVEAAKNQCVPAGVANGLTWLAANNGITLPHSNIIGEDGKPKNSLVAQLDVSMNRAVTDRAVGKAVGDGAAVNGTLKYLEGNNLAKRIRVQHQGPESGDSNISTDLFDPNKGTVSTARGITIDPAFIYDSLAAGSAVSLGYTYDGTQRGHHVDVIGAGYVLGTPFILHQSDGRQTYEKLGDGFFGDDEGTGRLDFNFLTGGDLANKVNPKLVDTSRLSTARFALVLTAAGAPEPGSLVLALAGLAVTVGINALTAQTHNKRR